MSREIYKAIYTPHGGWPHGFKYATYKSQHVCWYPPGRMPKGWNQWTVEQKTEYVQADLDKRYEKARRFHKAGTEQKPKRTDAFEIISFTYPTEHWDYFASYTYHGYYTADDKPLRNSVYVAGEYDAKKGGFTKAIDELGAFKKALDHLKKAKEQADRRLAKKLAAQQKEQDNAD